MPHRLAVVSACVAAGVALAAPTAQGSAPYVTHYKDLPANYTDDSLCHFDGYAFDVTVNGSDHVTIREYDTKTVFVDKFRGIVTGPTGKQLVKFEDAVITDDAIGNESGFMINVYPEGLGRAAAGTSALGQAFVK